MELPSDGYYSPCFARIATKIGAIVWGKWLAFSCTALQSRPSIFLPKKDYLKISLQFPAGHIQLLVRRSNPH
jgi:hypothetical protein